MVFSSLVFLCVFMPVVFGLHAVIPSIKIRNALLIVASLLFYAYGEPVYVVLMLCSTIANWALALLVSKTQGGARKAALAADVAVNLGVLGVFKYASMMVETFNSLAGSAVPVPQISLPIGISFFTFQALSYCIDVYRKTVPAERSWFKVLLYISFFPQLIAGPIIKYHDVASQISERSVSFDSVALGLRRFCFGLAKKVLIANQMAIVADSLFAAPMADINIVGAWLAAVTYALQIYFDFSAYSDMAIGLGKMFGFTFQENFKYPYASKSITDFWRRWHISLSTWFKEYLYIPLGGNRKGRGRTALNKLTVFFLCGLWHGASWTFVAWGLFHGLFLMLEMYVPKLKALPRVASNLYALVVVLFGWVLFRAETFSQALGMMAAMVSGFSATAAQSSLILLQITPLFCVALVAALVACLPVKPALEVWLSGKSEHARSLAEAASYLLAFALLVLCILELSSGTYNPFIYFRF